MRRRSFVLVATLALSVSSLPISAARAEDVAVRPLWSKKCASCHGEAGDADTAMGRKHKVENLTSAAWQKGHSDAKIRAAIVEGVAGTKMKAFKDKLNEAEIDALVRHVRTLAK